jgi:hypothetical protein
MVLIVSYWYRRDVIHTNVILVTSFRDYMLNQNNSARTHVRTESRKL